MHYPKMLFRPGNRWTIEGVGVDSLIVNSEADQLAAEDAGWLETVAQVAQSLAAPVVVPEPVKDEPPTRDEMIAMLERRGVDVDKRWGDKRLMAELEKLEMSDAA